MAMRPASARPARAHRARPAHPSRRGAALLATLAALAVGASGASSAFGAEAGVNLLAPNGAQLGQVRELGTHWVRMFVSWPDIEPGRGAFAPAQLAYYEGIFAALPAGSKVIVDAVNTPSWESGSSDPHAPPNPREYAAFVGALAQRWNGRVTAWELWNEEDAARWWSGGPDPAAYVALLKATYPVVKTADPGATVVLGGLTGNDYEFLERVYQAGGKGFFDAVGVHTDTACDVLSPYQFLRGANNRMIDDSFLAYREVRATMLANGDGKPIWMTEASWRTTSAACSEGAFAGHKPEGVTPALQATYLSQAYHCLAQDPYVQVALWFPLGDERMIMSGLVRSNGARKPSFAAMRAYVRDGDRLTEPCGVLTGPKITVLSPANNVHYTGPLPIHVLASSSQGIFRITLKIDGKLIRNYGGATYPARLAGYLRWQGAKHITSGRHTLTFVA
ncbi:MAG TPA: Ig-like domain-containing protein, partial [Solirubrobacteraceae bacterium]|nr:Ig-like domain-containing protein [Solirubrobacteraceae bacterium]